MVADTEPKPEDYGSLDAYETSHNKWSKTHLTNVEMVSAIAGFFFSGGDAQNVNIAGSTGQSGLQNNYLSHSQFSELEREYDACGEDLACVEKTLEWFLQLSLDQEHKLAMCGANFACSAPHIVALGETFDSAEVKDFIYQLGQRVQENLNRAGFGGGSNT